MIAIWLPLAVFGVIFLGVVLAACRWPTQNATDIQVIENRRRRVFGPFTFPLSIVLPQSREAAQKTRQELRRAGYYRTDARQQFLAIRNSMVLGWMLLTAFALVAAYDPQQDPTVPILIAGVVMTILSFAVPRLVIQSQANARVSRIQIALPDALDMITMCLSGGAPIQPAFERVSREIRSVHPDLALELSVVRRHAEAYSLDHALDQFADRIDTPEIRSLASLVSHAARLGTNVSQALLDFSDDLRRAYRQRAEERGNKNSVRLIFPVALCLAPPVYILLLAPAFLELRDFVNRENQSGGILSPAELISEANAVANPSRPAR